MESRLKEGFLQELLTARWGVAAAFGGLLGFIGLFFSDSLARLSLGERVLAALLASSIAILAKLIFQIHDHFASKVVLRAVALVPIDAASRTLVGATRAIQLNGRAPPGLVLQLYSTSTGISQPICLLRVIQSYDDNALAVQALPNETVLDIGKFFEEEARRRALFASPNLDYDFVSRQVTPGGT